MLDGGLDSNGERDLLNLFGSNVSLPVIQRMCKVSDWANGYFRPTTEGAGDFKGYSWDPITGTLFAQGAGERGGADPSDVDQISIGDCGLQATLAALADKNPELLEKMVTTNPNGSYTVTFYEDGKPIQIVVQPEVLRKADGTPITGFGDRPDGSIPSSGRSWSRRRRRSGRVATSTSRGAGRETGWRSSPVQESERTDADDVDSVDDIQARLERGQVGHLQHPEPQGPPGDGRHEAEAAVRAARLHRDRGQGRQRLAAESVGTAARAHQDLTSTNCVSTGQRWRQSMSADRDDR